MNKQREEWKDRLRKIETICLKFYDKNTRRTIRYAISELSAEGIIFINDHNHNYKRIERATQEEIDRYFNETKQHLITTYFNRLKPLNGYIVDEYKKDIMGQLEVFEAL